MPLGKRNKKWRKLGVPARGTPGSLPVLSSPKEEAVNPVAAPLPEEPVVEKVVEEVVEELVEINPFEFSDDDDPFPEGASV